MPTHSNSSNNIQLEYPSTVSTSFEKLDYKFTFPARACSNDHNLRGSPPHTPDSIPAAQFYCTTYVVIFTLF